MILLSLYRLFYWIYYLSMYHVFNTDTCLGRHFIPRHSDNSSHITYYSLILLPLLLVCSDSFSSPPVRPTNNWNFSRHQRLQDLTFTSENLGKELISNSASHSRQTFFPLLSCRFVGKSEVEALYKLLKETKRYN